MTNEKVSDTRAEARIKGGAAPPEPANPHFCLQKYVHVLFLTERRIFRTLIAPHLVMGVVVQALQKLRDEFQASCKHTRLHPKLEFTARGLMLGKETLIAPSHRIANGNERCDLSSEERIFTLLTAAYGKPVHAAVFGKLKRASELWAEGEKCLAQIHLAQSGLSKLETDEQAFRLFVADRLMELETTPSEICKALGYALPEGLKKYDPDQPRDAHGRWGTGGGKESGQAGSSSRSDGALPEGRSAAAPKQRHFEVGAVQFIGGTQSDASGPGIVPGAQYAQLYPEATILPKDMDHIMRNHTTPFVPKKGVFSPEYRTEEALRDLVKKAWSATTRYDVGPGKDKNKDATAIISYSAFETDLQTGAVTPHIIGTSGTDLDVPSVETNMFVMVIRSDNTVKTCYPINPLDRENPRRTYDEDTGDERN